jgi:Mn-dependent DtxR family transcriptional regulator
MLIGGDFNQKCENLLKSLAGLSENGSDETIDVEKVNKSLGYDRNEIKSYLEYLNDRGFIELKSIGGPLLYGHVSLTKKGLSKVRELNRKRK